MPKFKAIAWSCEHHPYMSDASQERLLTLIREHSRGLTHVIRLGDVHEAAAASRHTDEHEHTQEEEYERSGQFTASVNRLVGPRVKKVWCLGNHDDNLQAPDRARIPRNLRALVHWNANRKWGPAFAKWHQIPYVKDKRGVFELGQAIFFHGFDSSSKSDETEGLQMNYLCGGHGHRITIRGHTHRPIAPIQVRRSASVPLSHWIANAGTVGPLKPNYSRRLYTGEWAFGAIVIEGTDNGPSSPSREWAAQLIA